MTKPRVVMDATGSPIRCAPSSLMSPAQSRRSRPIPAVSKKPPINWRFYKGHHQVECFCNGLERFRRIAL